MSACKIPVSKIELPSVKAFVPVFSGKGGVGKSFIALNLALSFAEKGLKVGLLDLDIYGPSIPFMMNLSQKMLSQDNKLIPVYDKGIHVVSMGFLMPLEKAALWRGPVIQMAVRQFLEQVAWPDLDLLVIDTPPGTGDVHLALTQLLDLKKALIVSTLDPLSVAQARKSQDMLKTLSIEPLGIVLNESSYTCESCSITKNVKHDLVKDFCVLEKIPFVQLMDSASKYFQDLSSSILNLL